MALDNKNNIITDLLLAFAHNYIGPNLDSGIFVYYSEMLSWIICMYIL